MIRRLEEKDIDRLIALWLETNLAAHAFVDAAYWREHAAALRDMLPLAEVYVYEDQGEIMGFLGLVSAHIAGIFVAKEQQSQGVGAKLLAVAKAKHTRLTLCVYQKNVRALRFYLREQCTLIREQIDDATGEVELLMQWEA